MHHLCHEGGAGDYGGLWPLISERQSNMLEHSAVQYRILSSLCMKCLGTVFCGDDQFQCEVMVTSASVKQR